MGELQLTFRYTELISYVVLLVLAGLVCRFTSLFGTLEFFWREVTEKVARLPDALPWDTFAGGPANADAVVVTRGKEGPQLLKVLRFRGPDANGCGPEERHRISERLNDILGRFEQGWTIYVRARRKKAPFIPESLWFRAPAAWLMDEERRNAYNVGELFETEYHLTLVWRLPSDLVKGLDNLLFDSGDVSGLDPAKKAEAVAQAAFNRDYAEFLQAFRESRDVLAHTYLSVKELNRRETGRFLKSTASTNDQDVLDFWPGTFLNEVLPDQAFKPDRIPRLGDDYLLTSVIVGYSGETFPADLDVLMRMPFELDWTVRCKCLGVEASRQRIESRRTVLKRAARSFKHVAIEKAGGEAGRVDAATNDKIDELDDALREVGAGAFTCVEMTTTVTIWGKDRGEVVDRMRQVKEAMKVAGYVVKEESLNAANAWLGSIPGNTEINSRKDLLSSLNAADLMPTYTVYTGEHYSEYLESRTGQREPLLVTSTGGSTPFRINLHIRDVGHFFVAGSTGSGKSVLLGALETSFLRYANARIIIFDKDYSARALTMAMGGSRFEPGKVGSRFGFQPLARIDEQAERIEATGLIMTMLGCQGVADRPVRRQRVGRTLELLALRSVEQRTLTMFALLVDDEELRQALAPYTRDGDFGYIFDADSEEMLEASWILFEMSHLMKKGDAVVIPALRYIFHRLDQLFDGRPTLLAIDEFESLGREEIFGTQVEEYFETLRKRHVAVGVVLHDITKFVNSPLFSVIDKSCLTRFFLPDKGAESPETARAYKSLSPPLTDSDLELLTKMESYRDYYYVSSLGKRVFSLDLADQPIQRALLGMTGKEHQLTLDAIEAQRPPNQHAECILRHHGQDAAADLLRSARLGRPELVAGRQQRRGREEAA